jgi:hypothetical protein
VCHGICHDLKPEVRRRPTRKKTLELDRILSRNSRAFSDEASLGVGCSTATVLYGIRRASNFQVSRTKHFIRAVSRLPVVGPSFATMRQTVFAEPGREVPTVQLRVRPRRPTLSSGSRLTPVRGRSTVQRLLRPY